MENTLLNDVKNLYIQKVILHYSNLKTCDICFERKTARSFIDVRLI